MVETSDLIIASLSKIWHIVPIVIAIILFKKFVNNKDKKRLISKNEENEKNGLTIDSLTRKKYEDLDYKVIYSQNEDEKKELDINLICSKDEKTLLIKCDNSSNSKSITDEDIIKFHTNAIKYVKTNNIKEEDVEFRYIVHYNDVLAKSALSILRDDFYNCKYVVL